MEPFSSVVFFLGIFPIYPPAWSLLFDSSFPTTFGHGPVFGLFLILSSVLLLLISRFLPSLEVHREMYWQSGRNLWLRFSFSFTKYFLILLALYFPSTFVSTVPFLPKELLIVALSFPLMLAIRRAVSISSSWYGESGKFVGHKLRNRKKHRLSDIVSEIGVNLAAGIIGVFSGGTSLAVIDFYLSPHHSHSGPTSFLIRISAANVAVGLLNILPLATRVTQLGTIHVAWLAFFAVVLPVLLAFFFSYRIDYFLASCLVVIGAGELILFSKVLLQLARSFLAAHGTKIFMGG